MASKEQPIVTSAAAVGRRLFLVRRALGMSQTQFCKPAGIKKSTYSQAESGDARLGLNSAVALAIAHKLTLDWIYLGEKSNLPHYIADAFVNVIIEEPPRKPRKR